MGTNSLVDRASFDYLRDTLDTGWTWPLEGAQTWFEDMWNWVGEAAYSIIKPITDFVGSVGSSVVKTLGGWLDSSFGNLGKLGLDTWKGLEDTITGNSLWVVNAVGQGIGGPAGTEPLARVG